MRKHIDYYYKSYDKIYDSEIERMCRECFNDYGFNFEANNRRYYDSDAHLKKTDYQKCQKEVQNKNN